MSVRAGAVCVAVVPFHQRTRAVSSTGFNTGACITGDADCDGNPSSSGPGLHNAGGVDDAALGGTESAVIIVNFAAVLDQPWNASTRAVIGIPGTSMYTAANPVVAKYDVSVSKAYPYAAFGTPIPGASVSVANGVAGPSHYYPHLQLVVSSFSAIPAALGLPWDASKACLTFDAYLGSHDDAGIGETFVGEKTTCPNPLPSPLPDFSVPLAYLNKYPGRAPVDQDPVYYHPLMCEYQFQQKLTVRTRGGGHPAALVSLRRLSTDTTSLVPVT